MGGSCSSEAPTNCQCNRINTPNNIYVPLLDTFQEMNSWCNYGGAGEVNDCCYQIGDSYKSLGLTYEEFTCKLPDMKKVQEKPDKCKIPCSNSYPENCPQKCSKGGFNTTILETHSWCTANPGCCKSHIIDGTSDMDYATKIIRTCQVLNQTMVSLDPKCKIPCSNSYPENCRQCSNSFNTTILETHWWCTANPGCCQSHIIDGTSNMDNATKIIRTCQVLNQTMVSLDPKTCTGPSLVESNWRSPISSGAKCFTSHFVSNGGGNPVLSYVRQNNSLGNDFFCMNYFSWYEPLARYVAVATTGDEKLYSSMALYPNNYMMLQKCSNNYCNDVNIFQETNNRSFTPDLIGKSGAGLSCFKGTYPDVKSAFIYNADVCVRYSFKPDFNSSILTVYEGFPLSFLPLLQGSLFAQNVTNCSTENCNSIITPASSNNLASVLSPNQSGNMTCFGSIDTAGVVVPHPSPKPEPETKYCVTVTSVIDGVKMFFAAKSYELFSAYSKTANISVCNTSFCNAKEISSRNLSCYLTDPQNVTNHIQSDLVLPVDFCVKYRTSSGVKIYSGVTSNQLAFMNNTPSKFPELGFCQTNFCLVP